MSPGLFVRSFAAGLGRFPSAWDGPPHTNPKRKRGTHDDVPSRVPTPSRGWLRVCVTSRHTAVKFALVLLAFLAAPAVAADPARIVVHADQPGTPISRYLTGACIEDVNHEVYGGIYSQMIFGESFQEPSASAAPAGFKNFGGTWKAADGVLSGSGRDGVKLVNTTALASIGRVGVEVMFADRGGGNAGLIARVSQPGVGADNFNGYEISLDPEHQFVRLAWHKHNFELIRDVPCPVPVKHWTALEVSLSGSTIDVTVDGKNLIHYEHPGPLPKGPGVGLRTWQRGASFRNLVVATTEGASTPIPFAPTPENDFDVSGMWQAVEHGSAQGSAKPESDRPFAGNQSQQLTFAGGSGEIGLANGGLNHWGLHFEGGKPYEGYIWLRGTAAGKPGEVWVSLESGDGEKTLAEARLGTAKDDWSRLDFSLTPSATVDGGRFVIKLKQPGSVVLGHAFLQPGSWGRFKDLPLRRDVTQGLVDQGITVLRYGGSMVNHAEYRWKKMIGPRDRRPPYHGTWYPYSSNGWGIIDFIDLCEAAGFLAIPAFYMGESPQDMADFVEYVNGPADSPWGKKRVADGHAQPYRLRHIELGNEERVDEAYAVKFKAMAEAIWAKDPEMILIVGDFVYGQKITDPMHISGAASKITNLVGQQEVLKFAKQKGKEVWFDVHVDTNGPGRAGDINALESFCQALDKLADGAKHAVVVFEFNANNHAQRRAVANAVGIHIVERLGLPVTTRPIACSATARTTTAGTRAFCS